MTENIQEKEKNCYQYLQLYENGSFLQISAETIEKKNSKKKKVFLPTDPKKFGGVTGNTNFFFYA